MSRTQSGESINYNTITVCSLEWTANVNKTAEGEGHIVGSVSVKKFHPTNADMEKASMSTLIYTNCSQISKAELW